MTNFKKIFVGAVCALLIIAVPAGAATTVGKNVPSPEANCVAGYLYWQTSNPYVIQAPGVVTAMGTNVGTTPATFSLKVFRPSTSSVVGTTPLRTRNVVGGYGENTRIPVSAGDVLAIYTANGYLCHTIIGPNSLDTGFELNAGTEPGVGPIAAGSAFSSRWYAVTAVVEPDADRDGFGDETQDGCPANPARQAPPCVIAAPVVCKVPSLKGKTKSAAKSALEKANCKLGSTKKKKLRKFTKKQKRNRVRTQTVKAGTTLANGASVGITINVKKPKTK